MYWNPGTGKSNGILAKVREELLANGERVACLAPTHAVARLLPDGDTMHHFVGKFAMKDSFKGWILLDEISMCCLPLLTALDQLRLGGTKICSFGDWDQLPPHPESNSWRGTPVSATAFRESRLYKSWSNSTCFGHFDFYTTLQQSLPKAIAESKRRYPSQKDADLHVCISHYRRRVISSAKQAHAAQGKECVEVPEGDDPAFPLFVGTRLVGSSTSGKFVNGGRYVVTCIRGERACRKDELTEDEFETSLEAISKKCLQAWAMAYPKVQGRTESGTILLHGAGSKNFKRCHLYVGLCRVTDGGNVFISR